MRGKRAFGCLGVLFSACFLCAGCISGAEHAINSIAVSAQTGGYSYRTGSVSVGDVTNSKLIYFTNKTISGTDVISNLDGKVLETKVSKGDIVKKGDLLVVFDSELASSLMDAHKSKVDLMKKDLENLEEQRDLKKQLLKDKLSDGVILSTEYDELLADIYMEYEETIPNLEKDIKDNEDKLKNLKQDNEIYAEVDGVISKLTQYTFVNKGNVLMTISDTTSGIFTTSDLAGEEYFDEDMTYEFETSMGIVYKVKYIGKDEEEGVLKFACVDETELPVGITVTYEKIFQRKENVLCLENIYIHHVDEKPFVYVLDENGLKEMKYIITGIIGNSTTEIVSGLSEGEIVAQ